MDGYIPGDQYHVDTDVRYPMFSDAKYDEYSLDKTGQNYNRVIARDMAGLPYRTCNNDRYPLAPFRKDDVEDRTAQIVQNLPFYPPTANCGAPPGQGAAWCAKGYGQMNGYHLPGTYVMPATPCAAVKVDHNANLPIKGGIETFTTGDLFNNYQTCLNNEMVLVFIIVFVFFVFLSFSLVFGYTSLKNKIRKMKSGVSA
ncbi:nudix hydrolase domain protein [Faustovirus]|nr:hypothetical protein F-LCD7_0313 [Faustovirus]QJX72081.1 hypothetical protein F-M6_0318 [Faustovirus]QJX72575.1 nudix hydrolase domain protein [Faustovirus]QJX73072.1 hypothetical protein F-VV57_0311 [Faustovirus]QJX73579.1 hypothetical protein F-VV63_0313 [Faustovirus]